MSEIQSTQTMHKLGQLVWLAANKFDFVKLGKSDSVFTDGNITIQCSILRNNKAFSITEILSTTAIADMPDPHTVVDAMFRKLVDQIRVK